MTTAKDGMELTRVGPGTVMGELMRCYWLPALMSSELVKDGPPIRLMLLGEKLIAFRDSEGRVGVMDHRCPHRCASLFLGRNEESGLRCIYHGWKFDVAGNCVDMPSVPPPDFKQKVKAKAYPHGRARRRGLGVYGRARASAAAAGLRDPRHARRRNRRQIASSANAISCRRWKARSTPRISAILHAGHVDPDELAEDEPLRYTITDRAPRYHHREVPWGTQYAGYRPAGPDSTYYRVGNFLFPFWTQAPNGEFSSHMHARGWVPMDDTHTMYVFIWWKKAVTAMSLPQPAYKDGRPIGGTGRSDRLLPNTSDWLGRFRMAANPSNDWLIDRAAQANGTIYSGIDGVHLQDQAITESMGPIVDHEWEHLAPSDQMITRTRRRLLMAARALRDQGTLPPGADDADIYRGARAGYFVSDDKGDWQDVYTKQLAAGKHPPTLHAAE